MVKRIIWTKKAKDEWKRILSFWYKHTGNKSYSKKLNSKLILTLKNIKSNNYIGKKTSKKDIRIVICFHYLVFYKVEQNQLIIITIFDSRRNPKDLRFNT